MAPQPSGTVTLVFTDIEGSTRLLEELGVAAYREALAAHRAALRAAFARYGGYEVDYEGDSFFYAFASASDAIRGVRDGLGALENGPIRIRAGVHTGEPALDPPKYVGLDVHKAARIMAAAHGGQAVVSAATRELLDGSFGLRDLGEHRLKDLSAPQRLFQLGEGSFPPLRTLRRSNLPVPATAFLGREREVREIGAMLADGVRLLTLTGPGGTGKTRLAIQAAADAADRFPDGVWWVPLAPVRDPGLVVPAIAQALELNGELSEQIGERKPLLLLDNFEQVNEAAPELGGLLRACPNVRLLVTSREPLRIAGEREFFVPSLEDGDGTRLFLERAADIRPGVQASDAVAAICRRLDGLPLAIELAAARVRTLSPELILARLDVRLPLLTGGSRDLPKRQRTLRDTIAWSYELLEPAEQALFSALAVFVDGWTLEGGEEVCGAELDVLESLVAKSLLWVDGERFRVLETIREFASERLEAAGIGAALRDRHAAFYRRFAHEQAMRCRGPHERDANARAAAEWGNLRAALGHTLECGEVKAAAEMCEALYLFFVNLGGLEESTLWGRRLLASGCDELGVRARALNAVGCGVAWREGGPEVEAVIDEALEVSRLLGDAGILFDTLTHAAFVRSRAGAFREALRYDEECLRCLEALPPGEYPWRSLPVALNNIGCTHLRQGDLDEAEPVLARAVAAAQEEGSSQMLGGVLLNLAAIALERGRYETVRELVREALGTVTLPAVWFTAMEALELEARAAAAEGDPLRAARLLGAATAQREKLGLGQETQPVPRRELLDVARAEVGDEAWTAAVARGSSLTLAEAVEYVLHGD